MSGHNKWSKIKHTKGPLDAKRGKVFSKLSRELTVAAKIGGGDPELNARLRMVLLKAKQANMPADTIDRAVKKGVGGGLGTEFEDLVYEIYAPEGVAVLAEISTDNKNRTAAEIRHILSKNGGSIATSGAVTRLFHRKGQIIIARENADEDRTMEIALEAGADDFLSEPQGFEIITEPSEFETVHKAVEKAGIQCESAGVTCLPDSLVPISTDAVERISKIIELIDEHDDVKDIYSNAQFPEE
jgi:YebC/PmpR family DNA-binding regulatory protein